MIFNTPKDFKKSTL